MLKIEDLGKKAGLRLYFEKHASFFNPVLLKALFISFLLHLGAFFFFHIGPFKMINSGVLPSNSVKADIILNPRETVLTFDPEKKNSPLNFKEKMIFPETLSKIEWFENKRSKNHLENDSLENRISLNARNFWLDHLMSKKSEVQQKTLRFHLKGDLSETTDLRDLQVELEQFKETYARYIVRVENKTGKIFWIETKTMPTKETDNEKLKSILKRIQFDLPRNQLFTTGEIEIVTRNGDLDD